MRRRGAGRGAAVGADGLAKRLRPGPGESRMRRQGQSKLGPIGVAPGKFEFAAVSAGQFPAERQPQSEARHHASA